jgi:hypothetical protein
MPANCKSKDLIADVRRLLFMPADFARGLAQTMSVPPLPARTGMLTERAIYRVDDYEMVRRRTADAGLLHTKEAAELVDACVTLE